MSKMFELDKYGNLIVTIGIEDKIFITADNKNEDIGTYLQTTIQYIPKDKIQYLKSFIENSYNAANKQLEEMEKQLKPIKDLQDIDEKIIKHCNNCIDKGTKEFKKSMVNLNKRIKDLELKKTLNMQIEYIKNQIDNMKADIDSIAKIQK